MFCQLAFILGLPRNRRRRYPGSRRRHWFPGSRLCPLGIHHRHPGSRRLGHAAALETAALETAALETAAATTESAFTAAEPTLAATFLAAAEAAEAPAWLAGAGWPPPPCCPVDITGSSTTMPSTRPAAQRPWRIFNMGCTSRKGRTQFLSYLAEALRAIGRFSSLIRLSE